MSRKQHLKDHGSVYAGESNDVIPAPAQQGPSFVEPDRHAKTGARNWCMILVLIYIVMAYGNSTVVPLLNKSEGSLINAPDEAAHLGYIDIVREHHRLPTRADGTYEWHQPPLYYVLAAPVSALGPHCVRILNLLFGAAIIFTIFVFVRRLLPGQPLAAVGATAFAALLPMHQAVTSTAGNDVLLELLISLLLLVLLKSREANGDGSTVRSWRRAICIGSIWGLAILTKTSALLMFPVIAVALWIENGRPIKKPARFVRLLTITSAVATLFALPWVARNKLLYGEMLPMRAFQEEFAGTSKRSDWIGTARQVDFLTGNLVPGEPMDALGYVNLTSNWTVRTFEGAYTPRKLASQGIPLFLPPMFYGIFLSTIVLAAVGIMRSHLNREKWFAESTCHVVRSLILTITLFAGALILFQMKYFQAQGRYLYPAMLPMATMIGIGWNYAVSSPISRRVVIACICTMGLLSLLFQLAAVLPAYGV